MLLKVGGLDAGYGKIRVLRSMDLQIDEGEFVAVIGANGAGKTTLLRVLSGLVSPSAGHVTYRDKLINGYRPDSTYKLGMVHIPEGRAILESMTVDENLRIGALTRKDKGVDADLKRMYDQFPILEERRKQRASTLSGGERQILAIARALMSRPRLLMMDEPSLGLAPMAVSNVFKTIVGLVNTGMAILLVEQNANLALRFSDRAYVMETGCVVAQGNSSDLLKADSVFRAYLGEN